MQWQELQDGLKTLVAAGSGVLENNIAWDGEPEMMRGFPMAMLELQQPERDRSTDEMRYEQDEDGRLVPYIVGNRVATLTITVKSRDQRGPNKAYAILERMRTRLELPYAQQIFDNLGVALRDSPATQDLSAVSQNREESIAQLSMRLGYVVEERDEDHPEEWVERVELSGQTSADGEIIDIPESAAVALTFDGDGEYLTFG